MQLQYDYSNFNPEGPNFPSDGPNYFDIVGYDTGETRNGEKKLIITYAVGSGPEKGKQFTMNYNVGHSNPQARQIAYEDLGRIYYGCTGNKPGASGIDLAHIDGKRFHATMTVVEKDGYKNPRFSQIKPVDASDQKATDNSAAPAAGGANAPW